MSKHNINFTLLSWFTSAYKQTMLKVARLWQILNMPVEQVVRPIVELKNQNSFYRLLTEDSFDVVWRTDKDHFFTYVSPADERMRGFAAHEVISKHVFELLTDESIATILNDLQNKKFDGPYAIHIDSTTFVVQQRCKDGSLIWTEILSRFEHDKHGMITGYHGRSRDVTQLVNF
jgi:PAS domain S-box-containing protein